MTNDVTTSNDADSETHVLMMPVMTSDTTIPNDLTRPIQIRWPNSLRFGVGSASALNDDLDAARRRRVLLITAPPIRPLVRQVLDATKLETLVIFDDIRAEPDTGTFLRAMDAAREADPDAVIGLGGGSVMDVAKLVAALLDGGQSLAEVFGIDKLRRRSTWLACLPTTAGTGSEVSPNAILLDEADNLKKGVISPHLVPDLAIVDPMLTLAVPADVTAATGLDALTHCIEAYASRFAHPLIDPYALEGISLIARSLVRAVEDGQDVQARTDMALGSLYGGLCLGPVNTGAVHALSYPLGSAFHVPHGLSNAVLLPHVLKFNLPSAVARYARIADVLDVAPDTRGFAPGKPDVETEVSPSELEQRALRGIERLAEMLRRCRIPTRLRDLGVPRSSIGLLARQAMTVTRLLDRNPRKVAENDAIAIYREAW